MLGPIVRNSNVERIVASKSRALFVCESNKFSLKKTVPTSQKNCSHKVCKFSINSNTVFTHSLDFV